MAKKKAASKNKRWRLEFTVVVEIDAPGGDDAEGAAIDALLNAELFSHGDPELVDVVGGAEEISEVK